VRSWTGGAARAASLRPEKVAVLGTGDTPPDGAIAVDGKVAEVLYHGAINRIELMTDIGRLVAAAPASGGLSLAAGTPVRAVFAPEALHLMDEA
jgi:hypothetical protein